MKKCFLFLNNLDAPKEKYDLEDDGIFIQDDVIYVRTIEEDFDNLSYARVELYSFEIEIPKDFIFLNSSVWTGMQNRKIYIGNDITMVNAEGDDEYICIDHQKIKVSVYINRLNEPDYIIFLATNIT